MAMINCLTFVVGLLATSGSLVQARRSVGMYGENGAYRGGERDYTSQAYGSTDRYYRGGDYDYTANSEQYRSRGYDYPADSEQYRSRGYDYPANSEQYMSRGYDYPADSEQYRSRGYDYPANSEQYRSRGYDYPANSEQYRSRGYDYPANFERTNSGYRDWSVAEGSSFPQEDEYESQKSHHHKSPPPSDNPTPPSEPTPPSAPGQASGNPIDDCWRQDPNWFDHRQALASCAIGFGKNAIGGAEGPIYVVTDNSDNDLVNPKEGTLRYAVLQDGPLWIGFDKNMTIQLQNELIMTSHKTIDGRGYDIHISGGAGLTIQYEGHVIVHGVHIHDLKPTGPAVIRSNSSHAGHRQGSDGDAINIFGSHDVWVDHCYFARGSDGLVDAIMGSTFVSVTNNFFEQHDKVMLFGAHPFDTTDDNMQISVAFNHFAPGLIERVPRLRHGHAHIFNNYYASWGEYAIGGSEGPTILSEGNVFYAPDSRDKQVTKRINDGDPTFDDSMNWNWQSVGDKFLNGAFFVAGGASPGSQVYSKASSTNKVVPAEIVPDITRDAGPLLCPPSGSFC